MGVAGVTPAALVGDKMLLLRRGEKESRSSRSKLTIVLCWSRDKITHSIRMPILE